MNLLNEGSLQGAYYMLTLLWWLHYKDCTLITVLSSLYFFLQNYSFLTPWQMCFSTIDPDLIFKFVKIIGWQGAFSNHSLLFLALRTLLLVRILSLRTKLVIQNFFFNSHRQIWMISGLMGTCRNMSLRSILTHM